MAGKDIVMLKSEELKRLHIVRKIEEKRIKQVEAAKLLSLSDRQIRRIVKRVREEGDKGIIHKLRGKPSGRKIAEETRDKIIKLYQERYKGFGPTLAAEKLLEINKIKIGTETIRKWLLESGEWKRRRKGRRHCEWRERRHHYGEMVQVDGSKHLWFEDRGPKCVLMGYIDDATSNVFGRFYKYEGTIPAMESFKRYIKKYGIPASLYIDKHTTYKSNAKPTVEDELQGNDALSEFGRALKELGVERIHANSPQAKGRIERLFNTFQDRVVKEMRLQGIKNPEGGNKFLEKYLPVYNKRFVVSPVKEDNFHREVPEGLDLDSIFCIKTERVLRNDFTVSYNNKVYQVKENVSGKKVIVEEKTDGKIVISYKGKALKFKELPARPERQPKPLYRFSPKKRYIPPADHPWRAFKFGKYVKRQEQREKALIERQI